VEINRRIDAPSAPKYRVQGCRTRAATSDGTNSTNPITAPLPEATGSGARGWRVPRRPCPTPSPRSGPRGAAAGSGSGLAWDRVERTAGQVEVERLRATCCSTRVAGPCRRSRRPALASTNCRADEALRTACPQYLRASPRVGTRKSAGDERPGVPGGHDFPFGVWARSSAGERSVRRGSRPAPARRPAPRFATGALARGEACDRHVGSRGNR